MAASSKATWLNKVEHLLNTVDEKANLSLQPAKNTRQKNKSTEIQDPNVHKLNTHVKKLVPHIQLINQEATAATQDQGRQANKHSKPKGEFQILQQELQVVVLHAKQMHKKIKQAHDLLQKTRRDHAAATCKLTATLESNIKIEEAYEISRKDAQRARDDALHAQAQVAKLSEQIAGIDHSGTHKDALVAIRQQLKTAEEDAVRSAESAADAMRASEAREAELLIIQEDLTAQLAAQAQSTDDYASRLGQAEEEVLELRHQVASLRQDLDAYKSEKENEQAKALALTNELASTKVASYPMHFPRFLSILT